MSASELFQNLAAERLKGRALWVGVALALSFLVPYEVIEGQLQFLWQLLPELPVSAMVASLAPSIAGVIIVAARFLCRRAASLAIVLLAALIGATIVHKIGSDASAWGALPLPQTLSLRTPLALLALSATAAGANLTYRRATRRAGAALLLFSVAASLAFFLWPGRGEAPVRTIARSLAVIPELPTVHFQIGAITLAVVALWPAIVTLSGLTYLRRPAERGMSVAGIVALFGYPVMLLLLLLAWAMRTGVDGVQLLAIAAAIIITTELLAMAGAFEALVETLMPDAEADDGPDPTGLGALEASVAGELDSAIAREADAARATFFRRGWSPRRTALASLAAITVAVAAEIWLARPPPKGIDWPLAASSERGDALFGKIIPRWSNERWAWRLRVAARSSATAMIDVKASSREMVTAAKELDPALGKALEALASAGDDIDLSARAWYRLVGDVNAACRGLRMPYYLDPRVFIRKTKDGLQRHLEVDSYRVERVRQFSAGAESLAILHVRELDSRGEPRHAGLLGFSRDLQPFALLALNAVRKHTLELRKWAQQSPPACIDTDQLDVLALDDPRRVAMLRCGELLATLVEDLGDGFDAAVLAGTERHELQHQLDGPLLNIAPPISSELGAYRDDARARINRELSAHLSELTARSPRAGLVVPFTAAALGTGSTYHLASVILFQVVGGRKLRGKRGELDRDALLRTFDELFALGDAELAKRARESWTDLYSEPLPDVSMTTEVVAPGGK